MFASGPSGNKTVDRGLIAAFDLDKDDFIADGTWIMKDLSAIVGTGVKLLRIQLGHSNSTGTARNIHFRTNGQENTKNFSAVRTNSDGSYNEQECSVSTDVDGKIEYLVQTCTLTVVQFVVRGWTIL